LEAHIHGEQYKKSDRNGVFEKEKKGYMGLRFFWRMKGFSLEIDICLGEVFFFFFCNVPINY